MGKKKGKNGWKELPEEFWRMAEGLLPPQKGMGTRGRPPVPWRKVLNGIFYVLRTGCQWKFVPKDYGSGSTCHRYHQDLVEAGIFHRLWEASLKIYDDKKGIAWRWQSLDSAMVKAPKGGITPAPIQPTEGNPEQNDIRLPTGEAPRWRVRSLQPIGTT